MDETSPKKDFAKSRPDGDTTSITNATLGDAKTESTTLDALFAGFSKPASLFWVFGIGMLLIAGLAGVSYLQSQQLIANQAEYARIINHAGRQRMLSVSITLAANKIAAAPREAQENLRTTLQDLSVLFENSHNALIQGSEDLGLSGIKNKNVLELYTRRDTGIDTLLHHYLDNVAGFLNADDVTSETARQNLKTINSMAPGILAQPLMSSATERRR
ncbi:MAG: type IV pili methyl-accepting chemotaxis transducer N-terminal domain-containing protein [Alphaproteobacteria bacterium]